MQNTKESFQLLQLSEDSKSISDLELPEILPQRKRKVRRKTRHTGSPLDRHGGSSASGSALLQNDGPALCQNLGIWIAIFMTSGWLLILSYMTTVVYTENRRLEQQITKLTATNFHLPDVLQRWHETSKFLEQNQTAVNKWLLNIQQRMDDLDRRIITMRDDMLQKAAESDQQKISVLQNNVANFGAKMADLRIDIDSLKEHILAAETNVTTLAEQYNRLFNNKTIFAPTTSLHNETLQSIGNLTAFFTAQLQNITVKLFTLNDTLSQRVHGLDDDLRQHQTKLDTLMENVTSLSTHVVSMQNDWTKYRIVEAEGNTNRTTAVAGKL